MLLIGLCEDFLQGLDGGLDLGGGVGVGEGAADEGGVMFEVVEVVVGAEVAGAGHDVLVG
jgi:hypothetical protein